MSEKELTPVSPRGRGRPKVHQPRTVTVGIRLRPSEYDALYKQAGKQGHGNVSEAGRRAIRLFLTE